MPATVRAARTPPARFIKPLGNGVYRLTVGREWDDYAIVPVPCEIGGIAFSITALTVLRDAPIYHVHVESPQIANCDCIAGCKGTRCKHRDGIVKLLALGLLRTMPDALGDDGRDSHDYRETHAEYDAAAVARGQE